MLLIKVISKDDRDAKLSGRPADVSLLTDKEDVKSLIYWAVRQKDFTLAQTLQEKETHIESLSVSTIHICNDYYVLVPQAI